MNAQQKASDRLSRVALWLSIGSILVGLICASIVVFARVLK